VSRRWAKGGPLAAVLLLCNPPFWYSALTNPVRLALSAGATGVTLCLFMALQRQSSYWFVAAALLGLAAGLRPTLVILLIPLMLWTAVSLHLNRKTAVAVLAAFRLKAYLGRGALY